MVEVARGGLRRRRRKRRRLRERSKRQPLLPHFL
jgi:hypothetical protein